MLSSEEQSAKLDAALPAAAAWARLAARLDGELWLGTGQRRLYATDASPYQVLPQAVARPRHAEDCRRLVAFCGEHGVSLTARGGGTGLAGQCVNGGLIVDCSRYLNRIGALDTEAGSIEVEPGVVPETLNRMLARHGLMFGPDPSTLNRCTLGGMFGNNAWGAHAPRDGSTRDNVLGAEVLLSDASTAWFGPIGIDGLRQRADGDSLEARIYRRLDALLDEHRDRILAAFPDPAQVCNNTGYALDWLARCAPWSKGGPDCNLAPLLCGAEGTLAFATRLRLRLRPRPPARSLICAHFDGLPEALAQVARLLAFKPSAIELLDDRVLELTRGNPAQTSRRFWIQGRPAAVLLIAFDGEPQALAEASTEALDALAQARGCYARVVLEDARIDQVWALRRAGLGLLMGLPGPRRAVTGLEDSAVPPRALAHYIGDMQAAFEREGVECVMYGSVSRGLVHLRPLLDLDDGADRERYQRLLRFETECARRYGGCISTKHGDGRLRAHCIDDQYDESVVALLREVKRVFDPSGLFNPGKIIDPPPLFSDLRATPRQPPEFSAGLDWPQTGGFTAAAAQCQGAGACRKSSEGAMCPSFRASGEESLSTRGRANLLRLALDDPDPWSNPDLAASLAQCLACKSCRSECPANVDMARLKTEFLHQRHRREGLPLTARIPAELARVCDLASRLPALSNRLANLRPVKRLLGVAPQRSLPRFAERRLSQRWRQTSQPSPGGDRPEVLLLLDPYTEFFEPGIGLAAQRLLQALEVSVILTPCLPSGRAALSQGAVDIARAQVREILQRLPAHPTDTPLIGLEPSELLCLREDASRLGLQGDEARQLARLGERAQLLDEFLLREDTATRLSRLVQRRRSAAEESRRVEIHVHCHQRALCRADEPGRVMSMIPGLVVNNCSPTCCGMAGDFGYRQANYELSMRIGEQSLFPEVRDSGKDSIIIANGFSCRHQIEHGTGRRALHLAEALSHLLLDAH